jgi:hypothetical protein
VLNRSQRSIDRRTDANAILARGFSPVNVSELTSSQSAECLRSNIQAYGAKDVADRTDDAYILIGETSGVNAWLSEISAPVANRADRGGFETALAPEVAAKLSREADFVRAPV